jgi:hypothetical protein
MAWGNGSPVLTCAQAEKNITDINKKILAGCSFFMIYCLKAIGYVSRGKMKAFSEFGDEQGSITGPQGDAGYVIHAAGFEQAFG